MRCGTSISPQRGAICAVLTTLSFVVGVAFSAGRGVQTIIPDTGEDAIEWINDVDDGRGPLLVGAWFVILGAVARRLGLGPTTFRR